MAPIETVSFTGRRGRRLVGSLHRPPAAPTRGVVVAHGMLSSRASPKHVALCERAAAAGRLALRFDFAGRGESEGGPGDLTVSGEIDDLAAAIEEVRRHVVAEIAVVGSSLGGTVALLTARDSGIDALVTIAAPARLPSAPRPSWGEDASEVPAAFFADAGRHDPLRAAAAIGCRWRILHGRGDEVVPVDDAHALAAAGRSSELLVHPDAGHRFDQPEELAWILDHAVGFIARG